MYLQGRLGLSGYVQAPTLLTKCYTKVEVSQIEKRPSLLKKKFYSVKS